MFEYENQWRPPYELISAFGWLLSIIALIILAGYETWDHRTYMPCLLTAGIFFIYRTIQSVNVIFKSAKLHHFKLHFISLDNLKKTIKKYPNKFFHGEGFVWGQEHTQRALQIEAMSAEQMRPSFLLKLIGFPMGNTNGKAWLHGIETQKKKVFMDRKYSYSHTLLVGTTQSGKSVKLRMEIAQRILAGDITIVIDLKGDKDLQNITHEACKAADRSLDYLYFHPAFPEQSVCIDVLSNWSRVTQIATRLITLQGSTSNNDPFQAYAWRVVTLISNAAYKVGVAPNVVNLKYYIQNGVHELLSKTIRHVLNQHQIEDIDRLIKPHMDLAKYSEKEVSEAQALLALYRTKFRHELPSEDIDNLANLFEHPSEHHEKMITSFLPVLEQLTSGPLKQLLSPTAMDFMDDRPSTDMDRIISQGKVLYCGLDALGDSTIATAIGSMLISSLATVASERYNHGQSACQRRVSLIIDEAPDLLTSQTDLTALLNKSMAANFSLIITLQTISDMVERLKDESAANRLLGNLNNMFVYRTTDPVTQKYVTERFGYTTVKKLMQQQSANAIGSREIHTFGGGYSERMMEEEKELFSPSLLSKLPETDCIATFGGSEIIKLRIPILTDE